MHVCKEKKWHTVSLQKFSNEIHLRAAIDRFLRSLPLNKPSSVISDRAITEANKAFEHLQKTSEKRCSILGVLEPRNGKKPTSSEQMKKVFDSGKLGRAESKNPAHLQRTT